MVVLSHLILWLWVLCLQGPVTPAPESVCRLSVLLQSLGFAGQGCELSFYAGFLSNYQPYLVTVPFLLARPQLPLSVQKGLDSITDWGLRWSFCPTRCFYIFLSIHCQHVSQLLCSCAASLMAVSALPFQVGVLRVF